MHYVYVLSNERTQELYYGFTQDITRRLKEHQASGAWRLAYYEAFQSERDARDREQRLKHYGQSRTHLKRRIVRSLNGAN